MMLLTRFIDWLFPRKMRFTRVLNSYRDQRIFFEQARANIQRGRYTVIAISLLNDLGDGMTVTVPAESSPALLAAIDAKLLEAYEAL